MLKSIWVSSPKFDATVPGSSPKPFKRCAKLFRTYLERDDLASLYLWFHVVTPRPWQPWEKRWKFHVSMRFMYIVYNVIYVYQLEDGWILVQVLSHSGLSACQNYLVQVHLILFYVFWFGMHLVSMNLSFATDEIPFVSSPVRFGFSFLSPPVFQYSTMVFDLSLPRTFIVGDVLVWFAVQEWSYFFMSFHPRSATHLNPKVVAVSYLFPIDCWLSQCQLHQQITPITHELYCNILPSCDDLCLQYHGMSSDSSVKCCINMFATIL